MDELKKNCVVENVKQKSKRLRVAVYCRVDSRDELMKTVEYYKELFSKRMDWSLIKIYADVGVSGRNNANRKEFCSLISKCEMGDVDMIISKSVSQFSRSTLDLLRYIKMLKNKRIAIFFEEENIHLFWISSEIKWGGIKG